MMMVPRPLSNFLIFKLSPPARLHPPLPACKCGNKESVMSFNHHVAAQIPTVHAHRRVLAPADQRPQSSLQHLDQDEHKAQKQQLPQPPLVSSSSRTGGNYICHWVNCGQGIETAEKLYVRRKIRLILPLPPSSPTSGLISSSNLNLGPCMRRPHWPQEHQ